MRPVLAGPSRDQSLYTTVEAIPNKRENEIKHTCYPCNRQLLFTNTTDKDIIGNKVQLRYKHGHADR